MTDIYQKRYEAHQKRKAAILKEIIAQRHSDRQFGDEPLTEKEIFRVLDAIKEVPSSCNRRGVQARVISTYCPRTNVSEGYLSGVRDFKALLGGLLVGGVGWIHRADTLLLLLADEVAYKEQLVWMPYLDAGVIINQVYLTATSMNLAVCYCNPNIRAENIKFFRQRFQIKDNEIFCGVIALGHQMPLVIDDSDEM